MKMVNAKCLHTHDSIERTASKYWTWVRTIIKGLLWTKRKSSYLQRGIYNNNNNSKTDIRATHAQHRRTKPKRQFQSWQKPLRCHFYLVVSLWCSTHPTATAKNDGMWLPSGQKNQYVKCKTKMREKFPNCQRSLALASIGACTLLTSVASANFFRRQIQHDFVAQETPLPRCHSNAWISKRWLWVECVCAPARIHRRIFDWMSTNTCTKAWSCAPATSEKRTIKSYYYIRWRRTLNVFIFLPYAMPSCASVFDKAIKSNRNADDARSHLWMDRWEKTTGGKGKNV